VSAEGESLAVMDTRSIPGEWRLTARLEEELTNKKTGTTLPLILRKNGDTFILSKESVFVYSNTNKKDELCSVWDTWYQENTGNEGLFVDVQPGQASVGEYSGTITWYLENVPLR